MKAFVAATVALCLLAACVGHAESASCPNITTFRSPSVRTDFNQKLMLGFWYEQAFIDIAQIGATCQTMNGTINATTGDVDMAFAVKYGTLPFTIIEQYAPVAGTPGFFTKTAKMPFAKLLQLPTVVVNVTTDYLILYSCLDVLNAVPVTELVFVTRARNPPPSLLTSMEAEAKALGVTWDAKSLQPVDWGKC